MTTLSLLLAARDESLRVRPRIGAMLAHRIRRAARSASRRGAAALLAALAWCAAVVVRHGLVVAGLAAFVVAAWMWATIAGVVTLGASLLFLELRR